MRSYTRRRSLLMPEVQGRAKQTRRQNGDELAERFTKDASDKTGMSERTVQRGF
jgi:hypothetical protein